MSMTFHLNGRLVKAPKYSTYSGDKTMANITIASDREARVGQADFFEVAVFGDTAEQLRGGQPGDHISVSGEGRQNVWTTADGDTRYDIQFVARQAVWTPHPTTNTTAAAGAARDVVQHTDVAASR